MLPANRLRRGADIQRVRTTGKSWAVGPLVLYAARQPGEGGPVRAAFITGKKIGKAVERNRAKRWLREAFRERIPYIQQGWDVIIIARPSIHEAGFGRVRKSMAEALKRGRLALAEPAPPQPLVAPPAAETKHEDVSPVEHQDISADPEPGVAAGLPVHS